MDAEGMAITSIVQAHSMTGLYLDTNAL
jgi:hypothetical protein